MNEIRTSGPLLFTEPNNPTRVGEIINTLSEIYDIPMPRLGMSVYIKDEGVNYTITKLEPKLIEGVLVPDAKVAGYELQTGKSIAWNSSSNVNDYVVAGVYNITGERLNVNDGLPIANSNPGHTISARLVVLDSSIEGTGDSQDKCITQVLTLSNRTGEDGNMYIRTGHGGNINSLSWEPWATLQTNTNVGQVDNLDNLKDNGIYSGVWTKGYYAAYPLTFVCIVINDYFAGISPRRISQFVYGLSKMDGSVVYQSRVWDDSKNAWGDWEILNQKEISSMISSEIAKLVDKAPENLDTLKEFADWIENHGTKVAEIIASINSLANAVGDEIIRAENAEKDIKSNAMQYNTLGVNVYADKAEIYGRSIDTKLRIFDFPAATTEKAGVMTAEDKTKVNSGLVGITQGSQGIKINTYTIEGVYNLLNVTIVDQSPILNSGVVSARLTVLKTQEGNNTVITQVLNLNNLGGGEGNIYIRSNQNGTWKPWGKLQTNVEVGRISQTQMDDIINNGMYSGVCVDTVETFILVVINNYAIATATNQGLYISHLKYSLDTNGNISVATRHRDAFGIWSDWVSLDEKSLVNEEKIRAMEAEAELEEKIAKEKNALVNGDTIVGLAREVYSRQGKVDTATFLKRTTASGTSVSDGVASVKQIGGNIVKNLVNSNWEFGDNLGKWQRMGDTTINVNRDFINVNFKTEWIGIQSVQNLNSSHKYYMAVCALGNLRNVVLRCGGISKLFTLAGIWRFISNIFSGLISELTTCSIRATVAEEATFYNPILIDLTEMFGAGNEPTKEECDRLFGTMDALPQGLTIAQPTGLKSTGYNQFNPKNVLSNKAITDNAVVDGDKSIAVVECLPCKVGAGENNGYVIGYGEGDDWSDGGIEVYLTPLNPMEVEGELYMHKLDKDATYGTYIPQINGYILIVTPTTDKLCVHLHWSGDRAKTDYEEYIESNVALPTIPEMSEWGLAGISASGTLAADTIDLDRMVYTKRIGCLNLGSLNFVYNGDTTDGSTYIDVKFIIKPFSSYILSDYNNIIGVVTREDGKIVFVSPISNNQAEFKQAMQGVMLYYELAEPEEYPIVTKTAPNYIGSDYGVEEFVGSKVPLVANILFYMRSLVGETRNFLDRLMARLGTSDATAVADKIADAIIPTTDANEVEPTEVSEV